MPRFKENFPTTKDAKWEWGGSSPGDRQHRGPNTPSGPGWLSSGLGKWLWRALGTLGSMLLPCFPAGSLRGCGLPTELVARLLINSSRSLLSNLPMPSRFGTDSLLPSSGPSCLPLTHTCSAAAASRVPPCAGGREENKTKLQPPGTHVLPGDTDQSPQVMLSQWGAEEALRDGLVLEGLPGGDDLGAEA